MPSPSPREATEECLHAKQNVTPSPTFSQSLHGLCPYPAPAHPHPDTLEATVMIRLGLGREVAITPLKSLWTFRSVGLDSSFGEEGKAQVLGLGAGRGEECRLVGKLGGTIMEAGFLYRDGNRS